MLLRLLAVVVLVACLLALGSASASDVRPESCPFGAISAVGPVDEGGNGSATPEVACLEP